MGESGKNKEEEGQENRRGINGANLDDDSGAKDWWGGGVAAGLWELGFLTEGGPSGLNVTG